MAVTLEVLVAVAARPLVVKEEILPMAAAAVPLKIVMGLVLAPVHMAVMAVQVLMVDTLLNQALV